MSDLRIVRQTVAFPFEDLDNGWVAGEKSIRRAFIELNVGRHNARPATPGLVRGGELPSNVFEIDLAAAGLAGASGIEFIADEPIGSIRYILEAANGDRTEWIPSDPCPASKSGFTESPVPENAAFFGPRQYESALRKRLEQGPPQDAGDPGPSADSRAPEDGCPRPRREEVETAKAFFIELELSTNAEASLPPQMKVLIENLTNRVRFDAERRHLRLNQGTTRYVTQNHRPQVAVIAELFERLMRTRFPLAGPAPSQPTEIDSEAAGRAFERFANGDLRWKVSSGHWATQPSSYFYLCFGEFAIITAEHTQRDDPKRADLWTRLAIEFVRTERIFVEVYAPRGERRLEAYGPCNYRDSNRLCDAQLQQIRDEYADAFQDVPDDQRLEKIRELAAANLLLAHPTMTTDQPAR